MRVPSPKPFGVANDSLCRPALLTKDSEAYQSEHERIFGKPSALHGHTRYVYRNGERVEIRNPSTNPDEKPHTSTGRR